MKTLTYYEQLSSHLNYLQLIGLEIKEILVNSKAWIRCRNAVIEGMSNQGKEELSHRDGDCVYRTSTFKMENGLCGMITNYRIGSEKGTYKTYGKWETSSNKECVADKEQELPKKKELGLEIVGSIDDILAGHERAARSTFGFWINSSTSGTSDYLVRKQVGSYGLRFRSTPQYGNVAVVPMRDSAGKLWSYQILNGDGSKRMVTGGRTVGLYHLLRPPETSVSSNAGVIGLAEGYATAATCLELTGFPVACAFSSENLVAVTEALLELFSSANLIVFADNDRHLPTNTGLNHALEAQKLSPSRIIVATPNFGNLPPTKDASDWNDLVRLLGVEEAKRQLQEQISI